MKLEKCAVLGDPWIGGLLEWLFISIWITVWLMVTFALTNAGDQVIQVFEAMPSPIILLPFNWILWYWTCMIVLFGRRADCCRKSERLIEARLANLIYHLFRWPIFYGLLALQNDYATIFALGFEMVITILGLFVGIGVLIKSFC